VAPEVLNGGNATPKADVYSLGVLLFYLVTGEYPVTGMTIADLRVAHTGSTRRRLRDARADLPIEFVRAVDRALEPNPDERFRSAGDLEAALLESLPRPTTDLAPPRRPRRARFWWIAATAAPLIVAAAIGGVIWRAGGTVPTSTAIPAEPRWVMIAAFDDATAEPNLAGTLEHALARELAGSTQYGVTPRHRLDDSLRLMRRPLDTRLDLTTARDIAARDGGIRQIVTGRIERLHTTTLLSASIVDSRTGNVETTVSETVHDPSQLWDSVHRLARKVREALGESATEAREASSHLERATTPSLLALRYYSESYALGDRSQWPGAHDLVRQAIAEDPGFATAHIWYAWTLKNTGAPREDVVRAVNRALALRANATSAERLWIEGSAHMMLDDTHKAVGPFEALIKLQPDHPWAVGNLVELYRRLGKSEAAVNAAVHAADRRPLDQRAQRVALAALVQARDFERGRAIAERVRQLGREEGNVWPLAHVLDLLVAIDRGDARTAKRLTAEQEVSAVGEMNALGASRWFDELALVYLALGRPTDAQRVLTRMPITTERHIYLAVIAAARNDLELARRETLAANVIQRRQGAMRAANEAGAWPFAIWTLVRAGALADARRMFRQAEPIARTQFPGTDAIELSRGDLLLAEGNVDEALPPIERGLRNLSLYGPACRTVDDAGARLGQQGRWHTAIHLLQRVVERRPFEPASAVFWCLPTELRLAEALHRVGRTDEARVHADRLRRVLAEAEPDFPLLKRLHAIDSTLSAVNK
jgi:tetratricopeptide (TPR) repeat protein